MRMSSALLPAVEPPDPGSDPHALEDEVLQFVARQSRRVPLAALVADLILASIVSNAIDRPWRVWLWLALVAVLLLLRWRVLGALPTTDRLTRPAKLRVATALSALNGVAHGFPVIFLSEMGGIESAFLSILLLGLCTAAVGTTGGYRPLFVSFAAFVLLPLALAWGINSSEAAQRVTELSTAMLILLFGTLLLGMAKDAFRLFKESFEIRQQHSVLNHQLREALDSAEAANRAKTRFLASASHDLRQPMHTLTLFGAALALRPLDDASRRIAKDMSVALESLAAQLDALLDISKLDAGVVPVRPSMFFVADFLDLITAGCRPLAARKGLQLVVQCPANAVCRTDEALLARIVRNLVDNAIKYTRDGSVTLRVAAGTNSWDITVADTGIGIREAEQRKVFEEFYQIDNPERDRSRGLGLGLSIVQRLAQLLECPMRLTSTPGQGTQVTLTAPRGDPPGVMQAEARFQAPPSLARLCVLVLDDEESVRRGMKSLLEGLHARVLLAGCIQEALEQAHLRRPDIVLADLRMRGDENGIDAVVQLRSLYPGLPALFISGDIASDRLLDAQSAGIALLHKPVAVDTLYAAIEQALGNGRENHDKRKSVGDDDPAVSRRPC